MGLFNKLRKASATADTSQQTNVARAVLTPAVSTMISDGDVNEAEKLQLINVCSFSPIFFELDGPSFSKMIGSIIDEISANGHEAAIQKAAQGLSPKLRETAMCFALRIALADGVIEDGEKASLSQTGQHMGISPEMFGVMLEVIAMMQRPPTA
ncbi:MAG: tellurite resistance TerB family protein [Pseudomonadota bacterium]